MQVLHFVMQLQLRMLLVEQQPASYSRPSPQVLHYFHRHLDYQQFHHLDCPQFRHLDCPQFRHLKVRQCPDQYHLENLHIFHQQHLFYLVLLLMLLHSQDLGLRQMQVLYFVNQHQLDKLLVELMLVSCSHPYDPENCHLHHHLSFPHQFHCQLQLRLPHYHYHYLYRHPLMVCHCHHRQHRHLHLKQQLLYQLAFVLLVMLLHLQQLDLLHTLLFSLPSLLLHRKLL